MEIKEAIKKLSGKAGIEPANTANPFKKLHYSTDHLPFYHEFSSIIGLYGRHYIPITKCRWYQLHGGILQKVIRVGGLHVDTRIHACYPLVTEGGKNDLIYSIKGLISKGIKKGGETLFTCSEPISFHQESLIGRMVERLVDNPKVLTGEVTKPKQIKKKIENRGHLNNDFVEFDECNQLINSNAPDFQQAREYLSKAENPINRNKVEKRSVEDLPDEAIAYYPKSTHSYYFQPFKKLPEEFVLQGFGRRKMIPVGNIASFLNSADESLYADKLQAKDYSESDYKDKIISHLELMKVKIGDADFVFTEKAIEMVKDYSLYISGQASIHSTKINNFAKISKWTSLGNLITMSSIIAGSYYQSVVDENCVALAYMDLVELMQNTYDFIYERINGDFDYNTGWGGSDFKQKITLKFLYSNKAFSKESSIITIADFLEVVEDVYKIRTSQARNKYNQMKKAGLIDSAQVGQDSSAVWLKIKPEEHKSYLEGDKGAKGYTAYNNVFLTKKELITSMSSLQPLTPSTIKVERMGGENE